jgi:putative SOS response-associated peptidase YedK
LAIRGKAWAKKRLCLMPADGFYELKKVGDGNVPYSIGMEERLSFCLRGVVGGLERSGNWRVAAQLYNHHG